MKCLSIFIFTFLFYSILLTTKSFAQLKTYHFEQIDSLQEMEKKKVLVFIYTDWCKFCQAMKNTTFKNESVINFLNNYFYFISFNAEISQPIKFNNKIFNFKPTGTNTGVHELAEQLGTVDGKVSYPGLCVLNANYEIVLQYNAFLSAVDLVEVLQKLQ